MGGGRVNKRWTFAYVGALFILHELFGLAYPFLAGLLIQALVNGDWQQFLIRTGLLLGLPFLESLLFWIRETQGTLWAEYGGLALRRRMFRRCLQSYFSYFL